MIWILLCAAAAGIGLVLFGIGLHRAPLFGDNETFIKEEKSTSTKRPNLRIIKCHDHR